MVDRHRNEPGPHDAEMRRKAIRTVGGQDRDPVSALVSAFRQSTSDTAGERIELRIGDVPALGAVEIDDGDLVHRTRAVDQRSQIRRQCHTKLIFVARNSIATPKHSDEGSSEQDLSMSISFSARCGSIAAFSTAMDATPILITATFGLPGPGSA